MILRGLRRYLAAGPRPTEDAVMVLSPPDPVLGRAGGVIEALCDGRSRLSVVVIARDESERHDMSLRFPGAEVRALPVVSDWLGFATLTALRVRAVLAVSPRELAPAHRRLLRASVRRGVPVYGWDEERLAPLSPAASLEDCARAGGAAVVETLVRAVGTERLPRWSIDRLAGRIAHLPLRRLTGGFVTRIESAGALRARLGNPEAILCLGNGPSSVDPRLATVRHDTLFRVNHDWRSGGFLDQPDMVFAGVKRSMRKMGSRPIGVATEQKAAALFACRLFEPWHGPVRFAVIDAIARDILPPISGRLRPTTGAYMIGAAVALAPRRLVIAGMDMFRHPAGAYAAASDGGHRDTNAYTPSHDYDTDAAFIRACLGHFHGELEIYSEALAELIAGMTEPRPFRLIDRSKGR